MTAAGASGVAGAAGGRVPVLVAVTGAPWESDFVAKLGTESAALTVVRRCVDLADLVATGTTTVVTAALVWPGLRRLDKEALRRLAGSGVAAVGVVTTRSTDEEQVARSLGISVVVGSDTRPEELVSAVAEAAGRLAAEPREVPAPRREVVADTGHEPEPAADSARSATRGRLIAVWGPTGAPGRTTVAIEVASELARMGVETILADADVYGGTVAPALGLLDEAPGLVAGARLANSGRLTAGQLAAAARTVAPRLRVLTGIARASRWPELRVPAVGEVWDLCRDLAALTVVDTSFCIEQDEEIVFDTAAPRRNGVTLMTLECADVVVAVGSADALGVIRLVHALDDLQEAVPAATVRIVTNRVRKTALGGRADREVREVVYGHAGAVPYAGIPYDRDACAAAIAAGKTLAEVAPASPARAALRDLAKGLADVRPGGRSRRRGRAWLSRRGARQTATRTG
jgi:MinD-like ATPase involved in chromosome partitioning or flagellar assembly